MESDEKINIIVRMYSLLADMHNRELLDPVPKDVVYDFMKWEDRTLQDILKIIYQNIQTLADLITKYR